jgi:hypothetical protein
MAEYPREKTIAISRGHDNYGTGGVADAILIKNRAA